MEKRRHQALRRADPDAAEIGSAATWPRNHLAGSAAHYWRAPRLGILRQHEPRPLHTPSWYHAALPPEDPPLVSIVIPTKNRERFLESTIRSVIEQGYPRLDLIVQDGGSTDASMSILERYADHISHLESRPDRSVAHALNLGFRHARGELLINGFSDDMFLPGALNYLTRYMEAHAEVDVAFGHRVLVDEDGAEIGRWVLVDDGGKSLPWADFVPMESVVWRRELWERVGGAFDETFLFAQDWDLLLRFWRAGARIAVVPRFTVAYRVHPSQKTSSEIDTLGVREFRRLRRRELGFVPTEQEVADAMRGYMREHVELHRLYRMGALRL